MGRATAQEIPAAQAAAPTEPGAAMRALGALGNTALLGFLGAGAFFAYYTVRYDADTLQTVVHETHKEENQFPGSTVSSACKWQAVRCHMTCSMHSM